MGTALPEFRHDQADVAAVLREVWGDDAAWMGRVRALHEHTGVQTRHFALPLRAYIDLGDFGTVNRLWIERALTLGEAALLQALERAGLAPGDVDLLLFTTITGLACPSIDARLMNRLAFRSDCKRVPIFGLGCVAGAAGLARAADYLRGHPNHVVALLSVELCSLTFQPGDRRMPQAIATGLFGDGAAAAVIVGSARARDLGSAGPDVVATRSIFYPNTEEVMGWDIRASGFHVVLSAEVPDLAREVLSKDIRRFLNDHDLDVPDIQRWIAHPGGPKVLRAIETALDLPPDALQRSWELLARAGNLSSASVLAILGETLAAPPPDRGGSGLLFAMGPAFCSELVLLRW